MNKLMTMMFAACITISAISGGAFAQDGMKKDAMKDGMKDGMKKDAMGKDAMKK